MPKPISAAERDLRLRLDDSVRRVRSTLDRCPAVDDLDYVENPDDAMSAVSQVTTALRDAEACID